MHRLFPIILFLLTFTVSKAQIPKNGQYTYKIAFVESNGKLSGSCKVLIKDGKIKVMHDGSKLSGKKDKVIDKGTLMRHKTTGKWIIGHDIKDQFAKEIGGCTDGPIEIDFKKKIIYLC